MFVFGKNFGNDLTAAMDDGIAQPIAFAQTQSPDFFTIGNAAFLNQGLFVLIHLIGGDQFAQNHGHGFQALNFLPGIFMLLMILDCQHTDGTAPADQRHA